MLLLHDLSFTRQLPADSRMRKGIEFALAADGSLPVGEVPIDGRSVYARIMTLETEPREKRYYETHRDYLDIHRVLSGAQFIEWLPRDAFKPVPYDAEKDAFLYDEYPDGSLLRMGGSTLAVFWPEDAHRPLIQCGKSERIKVCVVKVRVG